MPNAKSRRAEATPKSKCQTEAKNFKDYMESDFRIRVRKVLRVLLWGLFVFISISAIMELYKGMK